MRCILLVHTHSGNTLVASCIITSLKLVPSSYYLPYYKDILPLYSISILWYVFLFFLAARFGHLNVVVWLVESEGCSALDRAQNGVTPVHLAAAKGSINCLKWLSQNHPK